jgi:hypothetical protein
MLATILALVEQVLKLINWYIDDKRIKAEAINKDIDAEVADAKNKLEAFSGDTAGLMDSLDRLRESFKQ